MRTIPTLSIGVPLVAALAHWREWRVAAQFDRTLLVRAPDDALGALTTRDNPGAHRAVVTALPQWAVGTSVSTTDQALIADGESVVWDTTALWDAQPRRFRLAANERRCAAASLASALAAQPLPDAGTFWDWLTSCWDSAADALHRRDARALTPFLRGLIGRGPGLTPAGDDVLQGMLLTLCGDTGVPRSFLRDVRFAVLSHLERTTPLGAQCIREALDGLAFGALKDLLEELPRVNPQTVRALLENGATSGTACALGIALALS